MAIDTKQLEDLLSARARGDDVNAPEVVLERSEGPAGLVGLRARARDASPGTAARALLVTTDGTTYARWLERGLAELARDAAWTTTPPAPDVVVFAANHALFDGLMALLPEPPPTLAHEDGALVLRVTTEAFPSGGADQVTIRIPPTGAATFERAAAPTAPEPTPIDAATGLERALADGDAVGILRAIRGLRPPLDDRARRVLATAAVLPNEGIAGEALLQLAFDPAARPFIRDALAAVPEAERAAARARAGLFIAELAE